MKVKYYIQILLLTTLIPLLTLSCSKKDEPEPEPIRWPYFMLEQQFYIVNAEAQTLIVPARTNMKEVSVEIGIGCNWIIYKDMVRKSDSDDAEFIFDINANVSEQERRGIAVFSSPLGEERPVTPCNIMVTQSPSTP